MSPEVLHAKSTSLGPRRRGRGGSYRTKRDSNLQPLNPESGVTRHTLCHEKADGDDDDGVVMEVPEDEDNGDDDGGG